ncbi:MAG TPA: hypothetical protein VFL57_00205, partial [Bryobacteraceae bacterium]|nr:hypothetical protein [Bryobacteraceae bacterium]
MNIYCALLERQERDPDDPEERPEPAEQAGDQPRRPEAAKPQPVTPVNIDFAGLKRRTRQVTRSAAPIFSYEPARDSRTLAFVTREPAGTRSVSTLYTIQDDGKRQTRITASSPSGVDTAEAPPARGGLERAAISNLNFTGDSRTIYFMEADGIYSVPVPASALATSGSSTAASSAAASPPARKRINFNARVKIDRSAEWAEMFGDAWRTMKYRFYDPKMHGRDWDAARAKYQPLVEHVGDRQELLNLINEMIGELNASHTGTAPPTQPREGAAVTRHLGLDLEA